MIRVQPEELLDELTTLAADSTTLLNPSCVLFVDDPASLPAILVPGDLTAPTYTGYASHDSVSWGTPFIDADGNAQMFGSDCLFVCTATGATNTITGAALLNTAKTEVIMIDVFDEPLTITNTGDGDLYKPRWSLASGS